MNNITGSTALSNSNSNSRTSNIFLIALSIWILAQLIRFIAIPLVTSVNLGTDSPAWMFPAILDILSAVLAIPLVFAILRWRSFTVWVFTITYFTMSIIDHIGAITNLTLIGAPIAFEQFNNGGNPYTAPVVQTLFDLLFLALLMQPKFRNIFFELKKTLS